VVYAKPLIVTKDSLC